MCYGCVRRRYVNAATPRSRRYPVSDINVPTTEVGHSLAVDATPTIPHDPAEYAPELQWPYAIGVYDRMRRTDAQVISLLRAVNLTIRGRRWRLDPNGADDRVVDLLASDLGLPVIGQQEPEQVTARQAERTRDRFSFDDHLRLALLSLAYGHMMFEQVYRIEDDGSRFGLEEIARLRKLAARMPATIAEMHVARDGGLEGIRQHPVGYPNRRAGQQEPLISVDRLVAYSLDREGGAWQGNSLLRACYKNWLLKDKLLRTGAIAAQRNGMGIPWVNYPRSAQNVDKYEKIARQLRAGETAGGAAEDGVELKLVGVSGSTVDVLDQVRYHDEQIAQSSFTQFLRLGVEASGNRALGESMIDFFADSINALCKWLVDIVNAHVVEDLVDVNFGDSEPAPLVTVDDGDEDPEPLDAQGMVALIDAEVVRVDDTLEQHLRDRWGLPDYTGEGGARESADDAVQAVRRIAEDRRDRRTVVTAAKPRVRPEPRLARVARPSTIARVALSVVPDPDKLAGWTGHRALLSHEEAAGVDPEAINESYIAALAALVDAWNDDVRGSWRDDLVAQIAAAESAADLSDLAVPLGAGVGLIEAAMSDYAQVSIDQAMAEASAQGVTFARPEVPGEQVSIRAAGVEAHLGSALAVAASGEALTVGGAGDAWASGEVADHAREHLDELSDRYLLDYLGGALSTANGIGRRAAFEATDGAQLYASEVMDKNTCSPCSQIDGARFETPEAAYNAYPGGYVDCAGGPRCRGFLVAVYE